MSKKKAAALITVGWAIPAVMAMLDLLDGKNPRKYVRMAAFVFGCLCFVGTNTYIMKTVRKGKRDGHLSRTR